MTAVIAKQVRAEAYQFLAETASLISGMEVAGGTITVQRPDEMNNIPGRCYVPTAWGTAIIEIGDFLVVYENGIVDVFTAAQFNALFDLDTSDQLDIPEPEPEEPEEVLPGEEDYGTAMISNHRAGLLMTTTDAMEAMSYATSAPQLPGDVPVLSVRRGELNPVQFEQVLKTYFDRYRLDYSIVVEDSREHQYPTARIVVNATGREVVSFTPATDSLYGFADGRMVTQLP